MFEAPPETLSAEDSWAGQVSDEVGIRHIF